MVEIKEYIKKGLYIFGKNISDESMLKIIFPLKTGEKLDLNEPVTFNQKLQWYKLYYRDPLMVDCADKYKVHNYVKAKGYENLLTPIHGVYNSADEINFEKLPKKFVLKTTNAMGTNIFVEDKSLINKKEIKKTLNNWLEKEPLQIWFGREWAYEQITPRIICEEFIDSKGEDLIDYKFHCFNGVPEIIQVSLEKETAHRINFYDTEWNFIHSKHIYPTKGDVLAPPPKLNEMLQIAKNLSSDFPHVRVDFYNLGDKVIFGELTFYTSAGFGKFEPNDLNIHMGNLFKLPMKSLN